MKTTTDINGWIKIKDQIDVDNLPHEWYLVYDKRGYKYEVHREDIQFDFHTHYRKINEIPDPLDLD